MSAEQKHLTFTGRIILLPKSEDRNLEKKTKT